MSLLKKKENNKDTKKKKKKRGTLSLFHKEGMKIKQKINETRRIAGSQMNKNGLLLP